MTEDIEAIAAMVEGWRPEPLVTGDALAAAPSAALAAVLGVPETAPAEGDALPPLWHGLYFLTWPARAALGPDGHPLHGRFLPPLPERRRMFAGGRFTAHRPVVLGTPAECTTVHVRTEPKSGRGGAMLFVTIRNELRQNGELCAVEEQDLVYRSGLPHPGAAPGRAAAAGASAETAAETAEQPGGALRLTTDPQLLFRVSALTANTHRIHYDEPYAREVEGYPGLVVHGPLMTWLMLEPLRREKSVLGSFAYRISRPAFVGAELAVVREHAADGAVELRVESGDGTVHATGRAELA
ncbi:hypothetical protein LO772_34930 [Yinghuangia sp. ASG 101]|uniref:hypothetical protein n=1 Tax=Yinghuangia sp. ASG 101 TaxID=2896848 RepID=UPI001E43562E|nr:hypothetical protein [Yinghuangia sp. ASG 101]UGQ11898.1 hypothetical protein LO772_34930 [Yinghuangia sp. ASG 101]